MFTGIIESLGTVVSVIPQQGNMQLWIESPISHELKIDQSVAHNGVCLTVVDVVDNRHLVTAIDETLQKTTIGNLQLSEPINLERCMPANGRFDGHIVQGHVDQTGTCTSATEANGSWVYEFRYRPSAQNIVVDKGSICINGTSLTAYDAVYDRFKVAIIPYTYEHTTIHRVLVGSTVNLEFDVIGKYVARLLKLS